MKKRILYLLISIVCFQLLSCSEDDNLPLVDSAVLISSDAYDSALSDNYAIRSVSVDGDFLTIRFSASGCNGESWKVKLIDSGAVAESLPPQRYLVLSLENKELCEALITKELTFDISSLRVDGNSVWLNLKNFEEGILYEY
ncbi:hypothetical protein [Algoriphagus litoralis]|uniref:hypothetical protein n=1 Tax=Algoriphagus litoralis TaxID=2202829 RepID=UPI000DBA6D48|nr:hypothetical protein [Algoriphagus litoralis]